MVLVGPQAVNKRSSASANPLDQAVTHKQIKDPIYRHPVYRCAALEGFVYIPGRKRKIIIAQNLQNTEAVSGNLEFAFL